MATAASTSPSTTPSPPSLHVNGVSQTDGQKGGGLSANRAELRMTMLKKLRPYPLRHEWVYWHDKGSTASSDESYEEQLKEIAQISTVQSFWQVFNNTPFEKLQMRDSLHLFKKNVKPIWEDPRNKDGGAWTFRVNKAQSFEFWKEIQMMAIGEIIQEVVEKGDDICGVSISVRFNSHLIMVWNRNANNQKSIDAIVERVLENLPDELKPLSQNYYYKKHNSHRSFKSSTAEGGKATGATVEVSTEST